MTLLSACLPIFEAPEPTEWSRSNDEWSEDTNWGHQWPPGMYNSEINVLLGEERWNAFTFLRQTEELAKTQNIILSTLQLDWTGYILHSTLWKWKEEVKERSKTRWKKLHASSWAGSMLKRSESWRGSIWELEELNSSRICSSLSLSLQVGLGCFISMFCQKGFAPTHSRMMWRKQPRWDSFTLLSWLCLLWGMLLHKGLMRWRLIMNSLPLLNVSSQMSEDILSEDIELTENVRQRKVEHENEEERKGNSQCMCWSQTWWSTCRIIIMRGWVWTSVSH